MPDAAFVAVMCVVFLLGGFVKGVIGLGMPTVAMGLLSIAMPPAQAAAMIVIPAVATNLWQILAGPALLALAWRFALMMLAVVVGTFATVELLTQSTALATAALGGALALHGEFHTGIAATSIVALLPALAGMYAGQRLRRRLNPEAFRRWFFAGLIGLGGYMVARSL